MVDQKHLENVEYFNCLGSMITKDARCTREIKFRISMAKASFERKKSRFTSKLDLYLRKKLVKCYIWRIIYMVLERKTPREVNQKYLENFEMWFWR
jgi:hypothetical protein